MHDEPPLRFFRQIGAAVEVAISGALDGHVAAYHQAPGPGRHPPLAIPFPHQTIPEPQLAHMVEALETQEADIPSVAAAFGYPTSLAERELARYHSAYHRYLLDLAQA